MALTMTLKLNAPGMTSLHKAGLAGLYMTLRAFDDRSIKIDGLKWELGAKQVTLHWLDEKPKAAFEQLITKSFWIDTEGFIRLAGLEADSEPSYEQRHHLYTALLNSFLQYGKHRDKVGKRTLTYEVDDKPYRIPDFEPLNWFAHQEVPEKWLNKQGHFNEEAEIIGWLYPGGSVRHQPFAGTAIREPLKLALLLLYAPVGVAYYTIKSRARGRKARLAMLIPEVQDLELYADIRRVVAAQGVMELTASSASDAALRMLLTIETNRTSRQFAAFLDEAFVCRVTTFGIVSWNEKQKTRTYTRSVFSGALSGLENYRLAAAIFGNRWQRVKAKFDRKGNETEPERFFVTTFSARELIADNVAQGKAWYHDIATYIGQKETREQLSYEREEISEMVEKATFGDDNERLFISVCHESWRRRLGKLGQRAMSENASFTSLVRKEAERLRTSLARCKNADTLRETVVDFWARAGANEILQGDGLLKLLPLFDEKSWRKTRDLALLALISYKPQTDDEAAALDVNDNEEGEGK